MGYRFFPELYSFDLTLLYIYSNNYSSYEHLVFRYWTVNLFLNGSFIYKNFENCEPFLKIQICISLKLAHVVYLLKWYPQFLKIFFEIVVCRSANYFCKFIIQKLLYGMYAVLNN